MDNIAGISIAPLRLFVLSDTEFSELLSNSPLHYEFNVHVYILVLEENCHVQIPILYG